MKTQNNKSVNPERLSGHNLVNYLIDNPNATGKFKWHTLRSCMWRNLLLKCPQYAKYGTSDDFQKITHCDALKIVKTNGKLMQFFPQNKFSDYDWLGMILAQPDILPFSPKENFPTMCGGFYCRLIRRLQIIVRWKNSAMEIGAKCLSGKNSLLTVVRLKNFPDGHGRFCLPGRPFLLINATGSFWMLQTGSICCRKRKHFL